MPPRPFSAGFVLFLLWLHVSGSFAQRWSGGRTQWSALPSTALGGGPGDLEHNAGLGALLHPNWASDPGDTQLAHVSAPLVNLEGLHRPHGHPTLLDLSQFRQRHHNTAVEVGKSSEQAGAQEEPLQGSGSTARQAFQSALVGRPNANGGGEGEIDWSTFRSVGFVSAASGDLEAPGNLEKVVAARSYQGEVIYFLAEESFFTCALNYVLNLHSVGFAHWIMLAPSADDCSSFNQAMAQVLPSEPTGCVWSQLHAGNPGWSYHGLGLSKYKRLQVLKMHYPAVLIAQGLNVLLTDVDLAFSRSFYPDVKSPPLSDRQLICQVDGFICNLGFVYSQNTSPDGVVHWMYAETTRRILDGLRPEVNVTSRNGKRVEPGPSSLLIWDQEIFGDALISAVMGKETRIGQHESKANPTQEELAAFQVLRQPGPITLTIPGKQHVEAKGAIVRSADNVVLSFPDYLHNFNAPAFQANKPVLHCVGAPRGPAKKFCLSVWGFWNDTVEQAGLTSGAVGGVSKSLQYDKVLRYAPGLNPSSKESWLRVVRYLFQAAASTDRRPIVPDLHCNALGWSGLERIIAGDLPLSPRCIFNQILAPGHWDQCGPNRDKTALQQYRWDQIMSAGANPWRRPTRPACDMLVPLSQDDVEYNRQQLSHVRAAPAQVICLNISDGAEAGQTMNLPQLDPPADPSHVASLRILLEHCRFP